MSSSSGAAMKEVFALFDRDGDGYIPRSDIETAIRATGVNLGDRDMEALLAGKDDAMFQYVDFEALVAPKMQGRSIETELVNAFKPFDRDNSGTISAGELKHVMFNLSNLSKEQVEQLIHEADPSSSGVIKYQELVRTLTA